MREGRIALVALAGMLILAGCASVPQRMNSLMEEGQYAQAITLGNSESDKPAVMGLLELARKGQTQAYAKWSDEGDRLEHQGDWAGAVAAWQKAIAARPSEEGDAALRRLSAKLHEDREARLLASETALVQGYRQAIAAHPDPAVAQSIQKALDRLAGAIIGHAQGLLEADDEVWGERFLALVPEYPQVNRLREKMQNREHQDLISHPLEPADPLKVRVEPGEPVKDLPQLPSPKELALEDLKGLQAKNDLPGIRQWTKRNTGKDWLDDDLREKLEAQLSAGATRLMSRADAAFLAEDLKGAIDLAKRALFLDPSVPQGKKRLREWQGMLENLQRLQGGSH